jgi:hypothetical protein
MTPQRTTGELRRFTPTQRWFFYLLAGACIMGPLGRFVVAGVPGVVDGSVMGLFVAAGVIIMVMVRAGPDKAKEFLQALPLPSFLKPGK